MCEHSIYRAEALCLFDQSDGVERVLRMLRPPILVSRCVSIISIDSGFGLFYPFGMTGDNRTLKLERVEDYFNREKKLCTSVVLQLKLWNATSTPTS